MSREDTDPERETYELQTIRIGMRLQEHVDIPILHPFRYHHKPILGHRHTYQRQHVWMTKGLPCYDLLAESLYRIWLVRWQTRRTKDNKLFLFARSYSLSIPSTPWLQHPDHYIGPSICPQTHRDHGGSPLGCNKAEWSAISEAGLGGHKSCIKCASTSCGSVVEGYSKPNR